MFIIFFRALDDDLTYILDGLEILAPSIHRASAFSLLRLAAQKNNLSLGRSLRSKNVMKKLFSTLEDRIDDHVMALSTVSILYFLLKDPLNVEHICR